MLVLIASGLMSGAFGASAEGSVWQDGQLAMLELTGEPRMFAYSPAANGVYGVYLLPDSQEADARAELWQDGECLAEGGDLRNPLTFRLTAGGEYEIRVSGAGRVRMEIARDALSRCPTQPLEIPDGESYSKLIARQGDAHWYSVKAESSGAAMLVCAPEQRGLRLAGALFDEAGRMLGRAETLASGTAILSAEFEEGRTYLIRLSGIGGGTGKYALSMLRSENASRPESVQLGADRLTVRGYASERLSIDLIPAGSCDLVYLDSSDFDIARGWPSGFIEGRQSGDAVITVYGFGGARSTCRVAVESVPVEAVRFTLDNLILEEGETRRLSANLVPANATDRRIAYASDDDDVAVIDESGVLTAVGPGAAKITATAQDGGAVGVAHVTVEPAGPKHRALLIGEQDYAPTVETVREGSVKSVEGVRSLLYSSGGYQVATLLDGSRDDILAAVRATFAGAREQDVSLVYITCHGFYQAGMTFFLMADGSVLSAYDLERELRVIPGEIILMVDCCGSGGVLAEAGTPADILSGITSVFTAPVGPASVRGSKYRVVASAYLDQDSYRIGFGASGMSTVFARALCDAAGWNIDLAAPSAMNADTNYDARITLSELASYLARRIPWYLNLAGQYQQTTVVYPENDAFTIFGRTSE